MKAIGIEAESTKPGHFRAAVDRLLDLPAWFFDAFDTDERSIRTAVESKSI